MSYARIQAEFGIGQKSLRKLPGLYGLRGMGQVSGVLPAGTQLVYNVTFSNGLIQNPFVSPAQIASEAAQNVAGSMTVVGVSASSSALAAKAAFTMTVQLNQDYTSEQMVQQVLDSAVNGSGSNVTVVASNISVVGMGSGSSNAPPAGSPGAGDSDSGDPSDNTSWCNQDSLGLGLNNCTYAGIAALIVGGFVVVNKFL